MKIKSKRLITAVMAAALLLTAALPASASSSDKSFNIAIQTYHTGSNHATNSYLPQQLKEDTTSTYVNYNGGGPYRFIAVVWGSGQFNGTYTDCTTYSVNPHFKRPDAIVVRSQKGYVHQDVYERMYTGTPYAQLKAKYYDYTGTAKGLWSPDSVWESGTKDFN